jgi:hypothetical protein
MKGTTKLSQIKQVDIAHFRLMEVECKYPFYLPYSSLVDRPISIQLQYNWLVLF